MKRYTSLEDKIRFAEYCLENGISKEIYHQALLMADHERCDPMFVLDRVKDNERVYQDTFRKLK